MTARDFFAQHGIGIFPLKPRSKEPACRSWDDYVGEVRSVNYGVRLGPSSVHMGQHLVVLDSDSGDAVEWIVRAEASKLLPLTPFCVSTSRGFHRYFRAQVQPPRYIYPTETLSIEIKSGGQYVVGPGSIHPTGATYAPAEWSWDWRDLPMLPGEVMSFDRRPAQPRIDNDYYEFPAEVRESHRHDELFKLIRSFKGLGASREETRDVVALANENCCKPPLREDHVFEAWFDRAWHLPDRPMDRAPVVDPFGHSGGEW